MIIMKKLLLILLFILCGCGKEEKQFNRTIFTFNTTVDITLYEGNKDDLNQIVNILNHYSKLSDYNKHYDGYVNLYDINQNAYNEEMVISCDLFDILELSKEYYSLTNGYFNIAIGKASFMWKDIRDNENSFEIADYDNIALEIANTNIDDVILDEEKQSVKFNNENLKLDLGGIIKGYALDKVYEYLNGKNYTKYLINAGASSVLIGSHYKKEKFTIGLQNPDNENEIYQKIKAKNCGIGTSGDYQNYFIHDGVRYHHILDPKTLENPHIYRTISVIGNNNALLDALSTAFFCMEYDEMINLANELKVEVIGMKYDGTVFHTEGVVVS